jgi:hypothetical protein
MRQSRAPARIVLNLPHHSKRENVAYDVPDFLQGLKSVVVRRCEDLGPATKAIPTLLHNSGGASNPSLDLQPVFRTIVSWKIPLWLGGRNGRTTMKTSKFSEAQIAYVLRKT